MSKYPNEILSLSMFHPEITSREMAERYVLKHSQGHGSYIVRPNTENDPNYVSISISVSGTSVSHVRTYIEKYKGIYIYYLLETFTFSSFSELLHHYREHRIHCLQGIDNLRLLIPLTKGRVSIKKDNSVSSEGRSSLSHVPNTGLVIPGNSCTRRKGSAESLNSHHHDTFPGVNKSQGQGPSPSRSLSQPGSSSQIPENDSVFSKHLEGVPLSQNSKHDTLSNLSSSQQDPKTLMKFRPAIAVPTCKTGDYCYYSKTATNKNFYSETYELLKNSETCECGLQFENSELPFGWAIHRSNDPETLKHVFFQRGEISSWDIPVEVVNELTAKQINFILLLYNESQQSVPACIKKLMNRVITPSKANGQVSPLRETPVLSFLSSGRVHYTSSSKNQATLLSSAVHSNGSAASSSQTLTPLIKTDKESVDSTNLEGYDSPQSLLVSKEEKLDLSLSNPAQRSYQNNNLTYVISDCIESDLRPLSFDSIPTVIIQGKVGSPTVSLNK